MRQRARAGNLAAMRALPALLSPLPDAPFPPADTALRQPDGLLAMGGDLTPTRLLKAYSSGIFPWYSQGQPILWWSPDPRMVFDTDRFRLASRFCRSLRRSGWMVRADTAFEEVIGACARVPRAGQDGTWITSEMQAAYCELHRLGHAHSVEVFDGPRLVGGIYGVAIGRMFFGESMFSGVSGGSKAALAGLAHRLRQWHWPLIDAQVSNDHLLSLGAREMRRTEFLAKVASLACMPEVAVSWTSRFGELPATDLCRPMGGQTPGFAPDAGSA